MGGGQVPEDPDQDQKINTATSSKLILYKYFYFSVPLNIKAINVLYAAYEDLGLPDLGSTSPLSVVKTTYVPSITYHFIFNINNC